MFEKWVLRRIFGHQRDQIIGGWRKLHNEELHGSRWDDNIKILT
jgi:hypothetical protein